MDSRETKKLSPGHRALAKAVKQHGSQERVAALLKVTQAMVSMLVAGKVRRPGLSLALRIQDKLGIPATSWGRS